jgi:hypothetical protein
MVDRDQRRWVTSAMDRGAKFDELFMIEVVTPKQDHTAGLHPPEGFALRRPKSRSLESDAQQLSNHTFGRGLEDGDLRRLNESY